MKKKFALRGLAVLAAVVALCMFFARTVQSITTPKVRLVQTQKGRLEQKTTLEGKVEFPASQMMTYPEAIDHPIIVQEVHARAGQAVKAGDLLFTAIMPDYEESMKKIKVEYDKKAEELAKKDAENRKRKKESERSTRYQAMMDCQQALSEKRIQVRVLALKLGITLPDAMDDWPDAAGGDQALSALVNQAIAARDRHEESIKAFYETYTKKGLSVNREVYDYIQARNALIDEMDDYEAQMTALRLAYERLCEVRAERDGTIAEMGVKAGESYDGKKAAYQMDDPDNPPVLRALIDGIKKPIEEGSKATVKGDYSEHDTQVVSTGIDKDGKRYVDFELTEELLLAHGGLYSLMNQGQVHISLTYRAKDTGNLLPAGAVRSDASGDYVYLVKRTSGGLMGESLKLKKQNVTVLDKSDSMVSIAEELSGEQVADREDRPIEDEARVMEYLN